MVSKRAPSAQRSRAFRAAGLLANSTMPLPVGLPRSSTTTTALSTGPNCENACSRSSLVTTGERFRTVRAAPCVANRMRIGLFLSTVPSNSALAISASVLDSFKKQKKKTLKINIHERLVGLFSQTTAQYVSSICSDWQCSHLFWKKTILDASLPKPLNLTYSYTLLFHKTGCSVDNKPLFLNTAYTQQRVGVALENSFCMLTHNAHTNT